MTNAAEFEPAGASFESLYRFLAEARVERPVFFSEKENGWIVTRYDDVVSVVRNPNFTVENALQAAQDGQYCPDAVRILSTGVDWNRTRHVQTDDGPEHSRFRRALMSVITPRRIREMRPVVHGLVTRLIDQFIARGHCEYVSEFAYPLAMETTLNLIGFNAEEDDFRKFPVWIDDTFRLLLTKLSPEEQVKAATHAVEFQEYIRARIASRRANPRDDLLSEVLTNLSSGQASLSEDELVVMMTHSFVGAGQETTKLGLTNAIYHLLTQRERWEDLLANRERVSDFVEECLRYDAPLLAWYRYCANDSEIAGQPIRKGEKIVILYGSANHDAARYPDAESFCPFRTMKPPHLTFNTGKHSCVGAPLARLEINTALEELSLRIPSLRLTPGQTIEHTANFANRNIPRLHLEWNAA